MAEETKTTITTETGSETEGATVEKKYSEEEMNGIVKKNNEKTVAKLLKELGISDKEKAKAILARAAEEEAKAQASASGNATAGAEAVTAQHQAELEGARAEASRVRIENLLLSSSVRPEKVERAAKLIDIADCLDEDGNFDKGKAEEAVKALLKEWPELLPAKADDSTVGFTIGGDGQQTKKEPGTAKKRIAQKPWNRHNY